MRFLAIARAIFSGLLAQRMATRFGHEMVTVSERVTPGSVTRTYECSSSAKALRALNMSAWTRCDHIQFVTDSSLSVESTLVWPRVCRAVHTYRLFGVPGGSVVRTDNLWTVDYFKSPFKSKIILANLRNAEQLAFDEFMETAAK